MTMTPEQDIGWLLRNDSVVKALINERVYPLAVPQDATRPAIAFQRISGPRTYSHSGKTMGFARIQLTCEGTSYMEASRVAAAAMAAAERGGWMVANERDGYSDTYDAPVKRVDVTKDYIA